MVMWNYEVEIKDPFEVQIQSDIKRKIKLVKFILRENRWYTLEEISTAINVSTKTIGKDLKNIKELMPHTWSIHIQKGMGVKLLIPVNESVNEIISILFRSSLTFQVLNKLLKQGETTVANLAEELHIQPYMVTKVLKKVEKDLALYDLKLHRKPVKIIGQEFKIITMFSHLYFKAYVNTEWPFQFKQNEILKLIDNIENTTNTVLFLSSRRIYLYYIAIFIIRKKQNYNIQKIEDIFYLNEGTRHLNNISIHLDAFGKKCGIHFSKAEKIQLTTVFKCLNYIYDYQDEKRELEVQLFEYRKIPIYNLVSDFIDELYDSFRYQFIKDDAFICSMIVHFRKRIYSLFFGPYIKRFEQSSLKEMKKKYSKTYLKVKEIYTKWLKKHTITNFISEEEILSIVIYIEAARINNNLTSKKILVVTKEGDYWTKYIQAILKEQFGDKIDFPYVVSKNLSKGLDRLEPDYDVDIILSTIPLQVKSHPIIQISPCISERDLHNIKFYLEYPNVQKNEV